MIIVDTSIWIDHLRKPNLKLALALRDRRVLQHPHVTVELALGSIARRQQFCDALNRLAQADVVDAAILLTFIEAAKLHGTGVGFVDAHLLATAAGTRGIALWTSDKRLAAQADRLGCLHRV